ncbi:MAG: small ribosomal subunit biogenesis GTPase RsgA [Gammaproteobacteria bacterium]|nr:small ribosomal subunit biogenesis GTPase RsgA [Gammaproteobacteria bacterium]
MSKRKLTKQQAWRVEKIQTERKARAQRASAQADELEGADLGPEQAGLVITRYGASADIEGADGEVARCHLRQNLGQLVTGDHVVWRVGQDGTGVVVAIEERHSLLSRPDAYQGLKPVAANVDRIIIVVAAVPALSEALLDRYLVAAETVAIPPLILLNKTDLLDPPARAAVEARLDRYRAIGYPVHALSALRGEGLAELEALIHEGCSIFVGQSGVGKSSLVNALHPEQPARVGELNEQRGEGRHTTTGARLYHFPHGGDLIDSAGIREFGLWHISEEELAWGFREFRDHLGTCRFRNCEHEAEPGCALHRASEEGLIAPERLDSFRKIRLSLREMAAR